MQNTNLIRVVPNKLLVGPRYGRLAASEPATTAPTGCHLTWLTGSRWRRTTPRRAAERFLSLPAGAYRHIGRGAPSRPRGGSCPSNPCLDSKNAPPTPGSFAGQPDLLLALFNLWIRTGINCLGERWVRVRERKGRFR
jgi:hypothetical protein